MAAGRTPVVVSTVVALAVAACSDDPAAVQPFPTTTTERSSDPFVTISTAPTTTPPTAAPLDADPFAVPHDAGAITEEYVERATMRARSGRRR